MRKQPQPLNKNTKKPTPPPAPPKPLREGSEKRCGTNPEPSTPRPATPPQPQGTTDYEKLLTRLLLKVNHVTCYHRHGNHIPKSALDELARFQEEVEELLDE